MPHTASGSSSKPKPSSSSYSSLSSIVSSLVRAQVGQHAAPSTTVTDSDLDRHVAEMLLAEAKQKESLWGERGNRAYYDQDREKNAPLRKPNTRFLTSVLRTVDDHNTALRRADEARERDREKEERDAAERRRRDRRRESGREDSRDVGHGESDGKRRRVDDGESQSGEKYYDEEKDRRRERRRAEQDRRERREDADAGRPSSRREDVADKHRTWRRHSRSPSPQQSEERAPRRRPVEATEGAGKASSSRSHRSPAHDSRRASRHSSRSLSPRRSDKRSSRGRSPDIDESDRARQWRHRSSRRDRVEDRDRRSQSRERSREQEHSAEQYAKVDVKGKGKERSLDEILADVEDKLARDSRSGNRRALPSAPLPPSAPPPLPSDPLPSKMDKYFASSYDPRLDFTLADVTDSSTGLIANGGFDSWDRMLDTVKARKEDKEEREEREKAERKAERGRVRAEREKRKRRRRGEDSSGGSDSEAEAVGKTYDARTGLLDMKYVRNGGTREWDRGKEEPT
ncbi:hypothetical protein JCM11641_007618 [Rhodosporidiobolus odoratus]